MNKHAHRWIYLALFVALVTLFFLGLVHGAVRIPLRDVLQILFGRYEGREAWQHIVLESRLPQTATALLAGGSLAVSGLMLQTLFKNPLAGPMGIGTELAEATSLNLARSSAISYSCPAPLPMTRPLSSLRSSLQSPLIL